MDGHPRPGSAETPWARRALHACAACGGLTALGGLLVLAGWAFDVRVLRSSTARMVSMKPNSALAFVLSGLALALAVATPPAQAVARRWWRALGAALIAVVGLIGALTVTEYAAGADLGIDQLLFHERGAAVATVAPGRMALFTAIAFMLAALSLAQVRRGSARLQQLAAGVVTLFGLTALLGYLYDIELARPPGSTQVALYSVIEFLVLGAGLFVARPSEAAAAAFVAEDAGGLMARRLLPVVLVGVPLLGALRLAGERARLFGALLGVGIMVLVSLVGLVLVVSLTAGLLGRLDRQRRRALEELAGSERRLRRTLELLVGAQDNERRRLASDLHDDALPMLAGVSLQLELARERSTEPAVQARLARAEEELRAGAARVRNLMFDLRPEALASQGPGAMLRQQLERMRELNGIDYELLDRLGRGPSAPVAAVVYRIAVEALRNVAHHAQAEHVRVELGRRDGRVEVAVSDDGIGMERPAPQPGHLGLTTMTERAELSGGGMVIESVPGAGTTVRFWVPATPDRDLETLL